MKKLTRRDLILEHYELAFSTDVEWSDDIVVPIRVWKPKRTNQLPTYRMMDLVEEKAHDVVCYNGDKSVVWRTSNPDYGLWDMQLAERLDYKHREVDIYVCSLLARPFSKEAQQHYEEHCGLRVWDRLLLMWDSREFDAERYYEVHERESVKGF